MALLLGTPHVWMARLLPWDAGDCRRPVAPSWKAFAAALFLVPTLIFPAIGVPAIAVVTAVIGSVSCGWMLRDCTLSAAARDEFTPPYPTQPATRRDHLDLLRLIPACAAGVLLVMAGQVARQLWLPSLATVFSIAAGLVAGALLFRRLAVRFRLGDDEFRSTACAGLLAAIAAILLPAGFGVWTAYFLWIHGAVASPVAGALLRGGFILLLALPAGLVLGAALTTSRAVEQRPRSSVLILTALFGWVVARWSIPSPVVLSLCVATVGVIAAVGTWLRHRHVQPRRIGWAAAAGVLALCGSAPWTLTNYVPARSAQLLFSGRVAAAAQSTSHEELLTALDDARLVSVTEGRDSVWTQWQQRGEQLALRENGWSQGGLSLDLAIAPESGAELLAGTIPLCVHPRAEHVLVVGLGSTGTLRSALETPVQSLTCWELDADLIRLMRQSVRGPQTDYLDDPRLAIVPCNPVLTAAAATQRKYDVIVLNERQLATWRMLGQRNIESYRRYRDLLAADGLFCQRFEFVDLGPERLLDVTRTLSSVFPQVLLWESTPGEFLLLASASEQPLCDAGLAARFETPQARRLLARIGWDCSLPLGLATITSEELLTANADRGDVSTVANAAADYALPCEVARWGTKSTDLLRMISGLVREAQERLPEGEFRQSLRQRLSDVAEQRNLMARFPDHYWAYRKTLRERLQDRPRSVIVQMTHELHPDDERRRDYLEALGAAATVKTPSEEQLAEVAAFAEPFDPLVSPFLPRKVAQLSARATPRRTDVELQHWLHSVYYSPSYDRSIRDATAALGLLLDHPESMPDATRRWDHIHALLEVLKERWTLRSQQTTSNRFEAADISETMDVAARGLAYLEAEADTAGVDADWVAARSRVLDRTFVRALAVTKPNKCSNSRSWNGASWPPSSPPRSRGDAMSTDSDSPTSTPADSGASLRGFRLVGVLTLGSRILGMIRDVAMAAAFGAGPVMDAFTVAFRVPNLARRLFGEGAQTSAFLPEFVRTHTRRG